MIKQLKLQVCLCFLHTEMQMQAPKMQDLHIYSSLNKIRDDNQVCYLHPSWLPL